MLTIYYGTDQHKLAHRLFEECRGAPGGNPLSPEILVVQNHGMGQWLSLYRAKRQGIAANMMFEFPSERIWSLIRTIYPDIPETLPSDRGPMTWTLMELFNDEQFLSEFKNLSHYIADEDPAQRTFRGWKLASKIADVFDQYLIYRPRMILDWQQRRLNTRQVEAEKWQSRLWRRLIRYWETHYEGAWLHRAQLQQKLWEAMDNGTLPADRLPDRISVFGVSTASPAFMETMVKLSKLTRVCFYQLAIDPDIKESGDYANPLLQSLGSEGARFISQLSTFAQADRQGTGSVEWQQLDTEQPEGASVFCTIRSDLTTDSPLTGRKLNVPAADSSIQVHSCHSPMREVEVLYDQLLGILDNNPDLTSSDILIMTPDIETYAPVVEAVFETPDEGQPDLPYCIADRGVGGQSSAVESFLNILSLCDSRFKVTDVMDLLDSGPVREAFDLSDEQLNRLEQWIRENRIRWGIDGPFKQKMNVPQSDRFTWQSGRNRMLLGYAMQPVDDRLYNSIFPYEEIATSEDAALAGRFSRFLQELFDIARSVEEAKSPAGWQPVLNRVPEMFLPDTKEYFRQISRIREAVGQLTEYASLASFESPVPFAVVRSWLQERLEESGTGGGSMGRGVTFSSLMPMRSIPFKVIGMIGMNEGAFPRSKIPIEFDLMHLDGRPGDPVRSEEDRYLFLENLLSARTHLYFSYVGQSNRQDADFPPSTVLREFLDYLEGQYGLESGDITTRHRLQAFSPGYFKNKEGLFSYSRTQLKVSQQLMDARDRPPLFLHTDLPEPGEEWKVMSVNDLISFFQQPVKYLLQQRLGIYPGGEEVLTEDREPFALGGLEGYRVEQELLDRFLRDQPLDTYYENLRARDMLPEGWTGAQAYRQKASEVRLFGGEIQQRLDRQPLPDPEVDITIGEFRIVGSLTNIYPDAHIMYRFGKARPGYLIEGWIRHLLVQRVKPAGHPGRSLLFTWDKSAFQEHCLSPPEDTKAILSNLMELYRRGLQRPLPLYCESSYAYAKSVIAEDKTQEQGMAKAINKWEPGWGGYPGEGEDPYIKLINSRKQPFRDQNEQFRELSQRFWVPFFKVLRRGDS
ncbi:DNA helicase/exodeoxyribonuclease V, gamma subunit [Fodinibius roseus]|uniref:DNA helicase/exodeoxyribonuclease V, gamma subunit n=1 Tax=Fodinibius roseus TaxID=1194090 RepID=A0A1M4SK17_9BACT|nr:exodeoxyribonuclease V subunit gamma [Fodinibius roseus]SHE32529.1 DNA helicase/exodeoxyribonuclease V, gamma subunit [Fodinibius roseus]